MNAQPSVIIVTKNEEKRLPACLEYLRGFDDVRIVDSLSTDRTAQVAAAYGRPVVHFAWDGRYPKKRQWCLGHLDRLREWILFIDADEEMTPALAAEMERRLDNGGGYDGFWITGAPVLDGRPLRAGRRHRKLSLFRRGCFMYPDCENTDDPAIACIGDIEGHYQPVALGTRRVIGSLRAPLLHHWADDDATWLKRHTHYALWEAAMRRQGRAYRADPDPVRHVLKTVYDRLPFPDACAFIDSYIWMGGFMDGARGLRYAGLRARYADMVRRASIVANLVGEQGGGGQVT